MLLGTEDRGKIHQQELKPTKRLQTRIVLEQKIGAKIELKQLKKKTGAGGYKKITTNRKR